MKYGITKAVLSCDDFIGISREEYENVCIAQKKLAEALNIEEKFNFVLENYVEYEQGLLNSSVDTMMFSAPDWSYSVNEIHKINRRLINLLTTCRLYTDSIKHDINLLFEGDTSKVENLKQQMSNEYGSNIGYRVFEALRNYAQHRSFPVHNMGHAWRRVEKESGIFIKHTVAPSIDVAQLKADGGFKPKVLQELQSLGAHVDIKPLLARYIESLNRIHSFIRDLLANKVAEWDSLILRIQNLYKQAHGDDLLGLSVVIVNESNRITERIYIFNDLIKRRQSLAQKNRLVMNLSSHIITNEVETDDP
ncbi:MAG: hypothetical protein M3247_06740 [Thermoproteota archaeon]|nr:hypothetical protein [Acidobacteriota bacterium]MDQ3903318.1 hypothetical protein [Thermoproteota archaeon]